jgi:hypothetical protein
MGIVVVTIVVVEVVAVVSVAVTATVGPADDMVSFSGFDSGIKALLRILQTRDGRTSKIEKTDRKRQVGGPCSLQIGHTRV